ncbi:potassium-transporting ATPase subunit KdpC [Yinghuangia seranimata]|uniref:potassium-transporting ATPase subunit KdpC n=1 Tax=Yinghuangia seranimata TaxID=408067 RepID=UPI00248C07E9|nr:potassium-transporting ATPase subunit KdpC [Yinghuangia seranimata]MDI2128720.1 potassium-transporting ATPase subunit KdpC [Yinghuangia seranimata]
MATNASTRIRVFLAGLRALLVLTVVLGVAYPLAMTGIAQVAFSDQANGSKVKVDGKEVGSSLLGQSFDIVGPDGKSTGQPDPKWFQPRPSAGNYDPLASGASNYGPENADFIQLVKDRKAQVAAFNGVPEDKVPADAVTASGSGLDPHISKAYALIQVDRVAKERGLDPAKVKKLVEDHVDGRVIGILGDERVNVLELNIALQKLAATK